MCCLGEEEVLDSIYLRPGTTGEETQTHTRLPYLSKVSLFDGMCTVLLRLLHVVINLN